MPRSVCLSTDHPSFLFRDSHVHQIPGGRIPVNHIALSPIRMACIGVSSNFCNTKYISQNSGYPPFVSFWFALIQWFEYQVLVVKVFLLAAFFAVLGPLYILESIFGVVVAPAVLLGMPLLLLATKSYFWKPSGTNKLKAV